MTYRTLEKQLQDKFLSETTSLFDANNELTLEVSISELINTLIELRDNSAFQFDTLIDLCGVDYAAFGLTEWETTEATSHGFSRAKQKDASKESLSPKLAVVYHLLSTKLNQRLRVKVFCEEALPIIPTACEIWSGANWFEREAYDLYGILFEGHPDLRRILTDYGFIGHPFRKDFPVSGHVEMRYDAELKRCVYEPIDLEPRVLVPKVIREDNRYESKQGTD